MLSQSRFETEVSKKKQGKGSFFSLAGRPRSHATISFWDFVPERCNFTCCHMRPLFFYLADVAHDSFFPERTLQVLTVDFGFALGFLVGFAPKFYKSNLPSSSSCH